MGMREAIIATMFLGLPAVAAADAKKPAKAPAKTAAKPADAKPAEKPDPAAPGGDATKPDDSAAADADADPDAKRPHVVGPKHVELGQQVSIDVPEGMWLFEREAAQDILRANGDSPDGVVAMVLKPGSTWGMFIEYSNDGYVDDSDANDLDADDLLESYRSGNEEQNKTRKKMGQPELVLDGWTDKPHYERAAHQLIWALGGHNADSGRKTVNLFTRVLGRNGFLSVDLIDRPENLEAAKQESAPALRATHFNPGSTYADHATSDRSSGIGLKGLVLGGAGVAVASKLGLLAKLGGILVAMKKGIVLVFLAIAAAFKRLFRRKKDEPVSDGSGWPPSGNPPDGMNQG